MFLNDIRLVYDPADHDDPCAPSEFVYIKKEKTILAEGIVNGLAEGTGAVYRPGWEGREIRLPSPDALVGFMLARLHLFVVL